MNKKILFGAALIGLIGFGSCVDNTESASVTAVRQAKAEQMKALGEAAKVEAQAKELQAQAEKELKDAQAAYERALAAQKEAQTAKEKELAAIEVQQAQEALNNTIKQNELNLEKLKAQVEREQALAKQQILSNATTNQTMLNTLYDNYTTATGNLLTDQQTLANTQANLAKLEAQLVSAKEAYQMQIALEEKKIVKAQNQIAKDEKEIETLQEYMNASLPELESQLADAKDALEAAQDKVAAAQEAEETAKNNADAAQAKMSNSKYESELSTICVENSVDRYNPVREIYGVDADQAGITYIEGWQDVKLGDAEYTTWLEVPGFLKNGRQVVPYQNWVFYVYNQETEEYEFTILVTGKDEEPLSLTIDGEEGQLPVHTADYNVLSGYQVQAAGVEAVSKTLDSFLAENYTKKFEAKEKTYNDCVKAQARVQTEADKAKDALEKATADKKAADDAVAAAQKVVTDAGDKATEEQTKALEDAKTKQTEAAKALKKAEEDNTDAVTALKEATNDTNEALTLKNQAEDNMTYCKEEYDNLEAHLNNALNELPNYDKYVAEYNEAAKAEAQAKLDVIAPTQEVAECEGEVKALEEAIALEGDKDAIEKRIDALDDDIIYQKGLIVKCQQNIEKWSNPEPEYGKTVEELNNEINKLTQQIAIDEEMVAAAKADLEAAIKAGSEE